MRRPATKFTYKGGFIPTFAVSHMDLEFFQDLYILFKQSIKNATNPGSFCDTLECYIFLLPILDRDIKIVLLKYINIMEEYDLSGRLAFFKYLLVSP